MDVLKTYKEALTKNYPELDEETVNVIAEIVVKKAKYGVTYEEEVEDLIAGINKTLEANF